MSKHVYIVSDLHLGSKFSRADEFTAFLNRLPEGAELVLNGDTVTHWHRKLTERDLSVLERLRAESEIRKVVWVMGNHDAYFELEDPRRIIFEDSYVIDDRIEIRHGHEHDLIRRCFAPLMHLTYFILRTVQRMGAARSTSTSAFAKKLTFLFHPYNELFIRTNVRSAKKKELNTIVRGHVHMAARRVHDGVLYINTGCWLEDPLSYVEIKDDEIELKEITNE